MDSDAEELVAEQGTVLAHKYRTVIMAATGLQSLQSHDNMATWEIYSEMLGPQGQNGFQLKILVLVSAPKPWPWPWSAAAVSI